MTSTDNGLRSATRSFKSLSHRRILTDLVEGAAALIESESACFKVKTLSIRYYTYTRVYVFTRWVSTVLSVCVNVSEEIQPNEKAIVNCELKFKSWHRVFKNEFKNFLFYVLRCEFKIILLRYKVGTRKVICQFVEGSKR